MAMSHQNLDATNYCQDLLIKECREQFKGEGFEIQTAEKETVSSKGEKTRVRYYYLMVPRPLKEEELSRCETPANSD